MVTNVRSSYLVKIAGANHGTVQHCEPADETSSLNFLEKSLPKDVQAKCRDVLGRVIEGFLATCMGVPMNNVPSSMVCDQVLKELEAAKEVTVQSKRILLGEKS